MLDAPDEPPHDHGNGTRVNQDQWPGVEFSTRHMRGPIHLRECLVFRGAPEGVSERATSEYMILRVLIG